MSVKLRVVTTVADHWAGGESHVRNLKWATDGAPIYLQTVEGSQVPRDLDVDYVDYPLEEGERYSSSKFYNHYDRLGELNFDDADVVLFMQQDIIVTTKLLELAQESYDSNRVLISFLCEYSLSVYDRESGELDYPRLWEGGLFVPAGILKQAIRDGVSFGVMINLLNKGTWLSDLIESEWAEFDVSDPWIHRQLPAPPANRSPVVDYLKRCQEAGYFDTMHEWTLYAKARQVPYRILGGGVGNAWRCSSHMEHFQGIETIVRDTCGRLYDDLSLFADLSPSDQYVNATGFGAVAFMCLLAGKARMNDKTAGFLLCGGPALEAQLLEVNRHASEWMTSAELERMTWAMSRVSIFGCGDHDVK